MEIQSNSRDYRRQEGEDRRVLQEERRYRNENGGREMKSRNMNISSNGGFYISQETSMEYRDTGTAPKRGGPSPNSGMVGGIRIRRVTPIRMINVSKPRSVAKTSKGGVASIESRKQESRREWGKWLRKVMLFYRRTDSQSNRIRVVEPIRQDRGDFKALKTKQKKKKKKKERKSQEEGLTEEQRIEVNPRSRTLSVDDMEHIKVEDMETEDEDTSLLLQKLDGMKQVVKMLAEKLQSYLGESQKAGLEFILRDTVKDVRSRCEENQRKKLQTGSESEISTVDDTILWPSRKDDVSRTYHGINEKNFEKVKENSEAKEGRRRMQIRNWIKQSQQDFDKIEVMEDVVTEEESQCGRGASRINSVRVSARVRESSNQ